MSVCESALWSVDRYARHNWTPSLLTDCGFVPIMLSIGFYSHAACLHFLFSQDSQWWILITFTLFHSFTRFFTDSGSVSTEKQQLMIHRSKHLPKVKSLFSKDRLTFFFNILFFVRLLCIGFYLSTDISEWAEAGV